MESLTLCALWTLLALLVLVLVGLGKEALNTFSTFSSLDSPRVINLPSARRRVRIGFRLSGYQLGGGSSGPLRKTPTPGMAG